MDYKEPNCGVIRGNGECDFVDYFPSPASRDTHLVADAMCYRKHAPTCQGQRVGDAWQCSACGLTRTGKVRLDAVVYPRRRRRYRSKFTLSRDGVRVA